MNGICDDKDLIYIKKTDSLINTISYSEKFIFSIYCIKTNRDTNNKSQR